MKTIVEMQFGSHVYGTNVPESDTDFKAIAIPSAKDIILQRAFKSINENTGNDFSKNTKEDVDRETFALHYYMKLLTEGQTVCLDMLFTPKEFIKFPKSELVPGIPDFFAWTIWDTLQRNKDKLVTKKMSAFAGYCQGQAAKYSLKGSNLYGYEMAYLHFSRYPTYQKVEATDLDYLLNLLSSEKIKAVNGSETPLAKIVEITEKSGTVGKYLQIGPKTKVPFNASVKTAEAIFKQQYDKYGERAKLAKTNQGVDWKALMHAVRVCSEAIELCETGHITFPRPEKDLLLQIRKGELPYVEVAELIEEGLTQLTFAKEASSLPEAPDLKWIEDFTLEVYKEEIKKF